jgi:CIC family chloride channel protein
MLGAAFGDIVHAAIPGDGGAVGAYALVGMGAVFAGAARAPITAIVILFELTGEYSIVLSLMLAISLATGVSHLISPDTVYTRKLLRRGIDIDEPADAALRRTPAGEFMAPVPDPLPFDTDLVVAAKRFAAAGDSHLPVLDTDGCYFGVLAAHAVMDALAAGEQASISTLTASAEPVTADAPIGEVLRRLDHGDGAVPVITSDATLVGWIRHRDILTALTTTATDGTTARRSTIGVKGRY